MVQQEVGYRISDSPSDNPTIKKSDNPLSVRALVLNAKSMDIRYKITPITADNTINTISTTVEADNIIPGIFMVQ